MEVKGFGTLRRLFLLWGVYAKLDFLQLISDLRLGLTYWISDLLINLAGVTSMLLLAQRFVGIGEWSYEQIIFMLGYAVSSNGIVNLFGSYNVAFISRRVGRGQLDHSLTQPLPIWLVLLSEGFMPFSSLAVLLPGIGLLGWSIWALALPISLGWFVLLILNLFASAVLPIAFSFTWGSLAFWAPRSAEEISMSAMEMVSQLKVFPLDGLGTMLLWSLLTIVPVGFVAWFPARALLGLNSNPWTLLITPLVALGFGIIAIFVFQQGFKKYVRTGSQHYSSFGHRG